MKSRSEERNIFEQDIENEIKVTPETTLNPRLVKAMKNLQNSGNKDVNNIVWHAKQENAALENLIF